MAHLSRPVVAQLLRIGTGVGVAYSVSSGLPFSHSICRLKVFLEMGARVLGVVLKGHHRESQACFFWGGGGALSFKATPRIRVPLLRILQI